MSDRCSKGFFRAFQLFLVCAMLALSLTTTAQARFITPDTWDPIIAGVDFNRYAYGANDPVNQSDPNGHIFDWLTGNDQQTADDIHRDNHDFLQQRADEERKAGNFLRADDLQREADNELSLVGQTDKEKAIGDALQLGGTATMGSGKSLQGIAGSIRAGGNPLKGGVGYNSFTSLKSALGSAGPGKVWHHIVEQCQGKCTRSTFPSKMINNTKNVVAVPKEVNQRIADIYNSKQLSFTDGKKLRDWLNGKSFKEQYEFGKKLLREETKKYDKDPKNYP